MKKQRALVIVACVGFILGLVIPAIAAPIEIRVGSYDSEQHFLIQKGFLPWCAEIEKRTSGKVKFKWYHGGSLVRADQTHEAVKSGMVDMVQFLATWAQEGQFPVSRVLSMPFLFESGVQGNLVGYQAIKTIPEVQKEFSGVKILGVHMTDSVNLHLSRPAPKTLEDMKGLGIWGGSRTSVQIIQLLGATPRTIKVEDLAMALQRKDVDGVLFPAAPLAAWKLTDAVNNHTIVNAAVGLQPPAMNLKKWNSLPPDVQKVFEELGPSLTVLLGALVDDNREYILAQLKKRGDNVYFLPPEERANWREKVQPIIGEWEQEMKSKGIDGQAILGKVRASADANRNASVTPASWWPADWKK